MTGRRFVGASGAEYEMDAKPAPFPTPARIQLAKDIKAGLIRHYPFVKPETSCQTTGNIVTARVRRDFVATGLADLGTPTDHNYSIVSLTPAGEEWLRTYEGTG